MLEALLGAPRGDEPQAKIAVGLRQLTGERVGGFVQNEDQFSLLLVYFAAFCFFCFEFGRGWEGGGRQAQSRMELTLQVNCIYIFIYSKLFKYIFICLTRR